MTEVSAKGYFSNQSKWLRSLLEDIVQARASDWGFFRRILGMLDPVTDVFRWRVLCKQGQVTDVSAGVYGASQRKWLRFLLEDIVQDRASYWGFCWRILVMPELVTDVLDWGYCESQSNRPRFLLEDIVQARVSD